MESTTSGGGRNSTPEVPRERNVLLYLLLLSSFACFFNLWGRTIENKDYLRYAEVGREILARNDWLVLHHGDDLYADKPPLHFWKIAVSYLAFGVNAFAARFPSAFFALAGVAATYVFARRILGDARKAFLAAMFLLSSYGYFWWARRTRIDMEFSTFFLLSLVLFHFAVKSPAPRRKGVLYALFWLVTGLAFLDKGPVAFMNLTVAVPYAVILAGSGEGKNAAPLLFASTAVFFFLPVLPWWFELTSRPEFEKVKEAFRHKSQGREQNLFYYLPQFVIKLFPASVPFFFGAWSFARGRRKRPELSGLDLPVLWVGIFFFLLHLISIKNHRYLLPVFAPACVVAAWGFGEYFSEEKRLAALRKADRLLAVVAAGAFAVPVFVAWHYSSPVSVSLLSGAVLTVAFFLARRFLPVRRAGILVSVVFAFQVIEACDAARNPKSSPFLEAAAAVKREGLSPTELAFGGKAERARLYLGFYWNVRLSPPKDLKEVLADPGVRGVIADRDSVRKAGLEKGGETRFKLVPLRRKLVFIVKRRRMSAEGPGD